MSLFFRALKFNYLVFIFLFLNSILGLAATRVISDFDDTIKRSHISSDHQSAYDIIDGGARTIGRSVLYKKIFTAIPELYNAFSENFQKQTGSNFAGVYVLSASPHFLIKSLIEESLEFAKIEYDQLFTRNFDELLPGKKIDYKISKIKSVIEGNLDSLILIGDDVEADPQVYKAVESQYSKRIASIYIRRIKNQELAQGITGFYSAFEVAAAEFSQGRMSYAQVEKVANAILKTQDSKMRRVIPYYAYCPVKMEEFTPVLNHELYELEFLVQLKITDYCKNR